MAGMKPGRGWCGAAAAALLMAVLPGGGAAARAAPATPPMAAARIESVQPIDDRLMRVVVDTPEMGPVQVLVLLPRHRDRPRPTLYLLDGRSAHAEGSHWLDRGDAERFFADKPVNVVFTTGGTASYYTDWQRTDPVLGRYRWETFLTRDLPPLIDARFAGDGRNAIAGLSMGAQAALMLAVRHPELYRGVAGYSGCYGSTGGIGAAQMRAVVASYGGDIGNMFGRPGDPDWAAHDVLALANNLRGKDIYLSAGSGLPGPHETAQTSGLPDIVLVGGAVEAVSNLCTHRLADRLAQLAIPAAVDFRPTGTHSWPYWADELRLSWPVLARALLR
jgi:S-formylglutathione hydrolase FrmB